MYDCNPYIECIFIFTALIHITLVLMTCATEGKEVTSQALGNNKCDKEREKKELEKNRKEKEMGEKWKKKGKKKEKGRSIKCFQHNNRRGGK